MEQSNVVLTVSGISMHINSNPILRRGTLAIMTDGMVFSDKWQFGTNLIISKLQSLKGAVVLPFDEITEVEMGKYMVLYDELRIHSRNGNVYKFIKDGLGKGSIAQAADAIHEHWKK